MRRTATTLLLLITTIFASAQIKQTYLPDFKKGQTAIYEYICTKTHRRNCDNVTVDGLELNSPFVSLGGVFSLMDISGMIPTGDSISNKFSLKVLDLTPYSYIMEVKLLDINLPKVIEKEEGDQEVLGIINFIKTLKLYLMMSKRLGEWKVINADELYRQVINEGHRRKISILEGKNKQSDEEIIEDMRKANAIDEFISLFVPGINAFTDAYQLRCENGHRRERRFA